MTPADAASVAALIRAAFAAQPLRTDPPPSALLETAATVTEHLAKGGGAVIEADGRVIGSVLWEPKDGGLYIGRLAVDPSWRGRGLGKMLVAAAEQAARELGLKRLHLGTRLPLIGNRRLFAACGFVETEQTAHPGYSAPTSVTMEKWLAK